MAAAAFEFVQGSERLDWGVLVAIDLQRLIKDTNVDTLQRIVENLAFARVTRDEAAMFTPEHILHLFTLCQLVIQYLVCSQECLAKMNVKLSERVQEAQHRWNSAEAERERLHEENTILRKEVKAQRRTLLAYEYNNSNTIAIAERERVGGGGRGGVGCPYVCPHCGDAYAKNESLQSHIRKRHQKQQTQTQQQQQQLQSQQQQQQQQQVGKTTEIFEMQVRQLQEKVDRLEQQLGREKERNESLQRESMMMMLQATIGGAARTQSQSQSSQQQTQSQSSQQQEKEKEKEKEEQRVSAESSKREETLARLPHVHTAPVQVITPEVSAIPIMPDVAALQRYNLSRQQESTNNALLRQISELEKVVRELQSAKKETGGTDTHAPSLDSKQTTIATTATTTTTQPVSHTPSWLSAPGGDSIVRDHNNTPALLQQTGRGPESTTTASITTSTLPGVSSSADRVVLSIPQPTQTPQQQQQPQQQSQLQQQQQQRYVSAPPVPVSNTTNAPLITPQQQHSQQQTHVSVPPVPTHSTTTRDSAIPSYSQLLQQQSQQQQQPPAPPPRQQPQEQQQPYVSVPPVPTPSTTNASVITPQQQLQQQSQQQQLQQQQPQVSVPPVPRPSTASAPVITPQPQQLQQLQQQHGITFPISPTPAPTPAAVPTTGIRTVGSTSSTYSTSTSSINRPYTTTTTTSTTPAATTMQSTLPTTHTTAPGPPLSALNIPTAANSSLLPKSGSSDPAVPPWSLSKQPSNPPRNLGTTTASTPEWLRSNSLRDDSSRDGSTIAANPPHVHSSSLGSAHLSAPQPVPLASSNTHLPPSGLQVGQLTYANVASGSHLTTHGISPQVPVPSPMPTVATGGIPSYSNAVTVSATGVPHATVPIARQARAPSSSTSSSRSSSYESSTSS